MPDCTAFDVYQPPPDGTVVSIGNFDGVHRGHAAIVAALREHALRHGVPAVGITLDPHPLAVLAPERAPPTLTTAAERATLLRRAGADAVVVLRSEPALLAMPAEDFLAHFVRRLRPRAFVEGADFNFGKARGGSIETLRQHGARYGYEVHTVDTFRAAELASAPRISSSSIRQALVDGRLDDANAMLGRPYRIVGRVVPGDARGRTIGFPTANLSDVPHMLPQEAVYAGAAQLESGELHAAAVNVGLQPTFGGHRARVEAHLLEYSGDLVGQHVGIYFLARLRPQQRCESVAELVEQIRRDVARSREHFAAETELRAQCYSL